MSHPDEQTATTRVRRPPPSFRRVAVRRTEWRTPRLIKVTLGGDELDGLVVTQPASSVRVLLPSSDRSELVIPDWTGNEFQLPGGERPVIRTLTPRRVDARALELDVEIVVHGDGRASSWAAAAEPGDPTAVSGPARGYDIDGDVPAFMLAGDETAIPAISQILEALPPTADVQVHIEIAESAARLELPDHPRATVTWHELTDGDVPGTALVPAVSHADLATGARVWAAGEAAAVQRIRRHLFEERSLPRSRATVRGYWKHGRSGDT